MKKIILILLLSISVSAGYTQEQKQENEFKSYSLGFIAADIALDYGGYFSYHVKRNVFRISFVKVHRLGLNSITVQDLLSGYGIGTAYQFEIISPEKNNIYRPKIVVKNMYKTVQGTNMRQSGGTYQIKFDGDYTSYQFDIGIVNAFNVKNIEFQITPFISQYKDFLHAYNVVEEIDEDDMFDTPTERCMLINVWLTSFGIEASIGYRF
jgi:hypothetical protein